MDGHSNDPDPAFENLSETYAALNREGDAREDALPSNTWGFTLICWIYKDNNRS